MYTLCVIRYWTRSTSKSKCVYPFSQKQTLDSDCSCRIDLQALRMAERNTDNKEVYSQGVLEAQKNKVKLEEIQRADAKLRKKGLGMMSQ